MGTRSVLSVCSFLFAAFLSFTATAQGVQRMSVNPTSPEQGATMTINYSRAAGQNGDIVINLTWTPAGGTPTSVTIPAGQNSAQVTVPANASQVVLQDTTGNSTNLTVSIMPGTGAPTGVQLRDPDGRYAGIEVVGNGGFARRSRRL